MPDRFPTIPLAQVRALVGAVAMERAIPYAADGSVLDLKWDAEARALDGRVQGGERTPYRCSVYLREEFGVWLPVSSECTCPVGTRCKHAAALMLASSRLGRGERTRRDPLSAARFAAGADVAPPQPERFARSGGPVGPAAAATRPARPAPPAPPQPEWRRVLAGGASTGYPQQAQRRHPLALQFEVRERVRRSLGRWGHANESTQAATAKSQGLLVVTLRIAEPGARGWIAANTDWAKVGYDQSGFLYDPLQTRWFGEFAALARASQPRFIGQDAKRLVLSEFESPLFWRLLDDARERGIELVGLGGRVARAAEAEVVGLLDENARTSDMRLRADARFDGVHDPDRAFAAVGTIGRHGLFAVEWLGAKEPLVRIGPLLRPLGAEARGLLEAGELMIPAADRTEFFGEFFPRLTGVVFDADGPVEVPVFDPPTLTLRLEFASAHELHVSWSWQRDAPDAAVEAAIEREVRRVLAAPPGAGGAASAAASERAVGYPEPTTLREFDAADFVEHVLPELEAIEGLVVELVGERPDYRELTEAAKLTVTAVESEDRDWLDLGFTVQIGEYTVPFGPLFRALATGKARLMLVDGSHLSLNRPEFDRLRELIAEAGELKEWENGKLPLHRARIDLWSEFEDLADESEAAVAWVEHVKAMTGAPAERPTPAGLDAELREYQREGFAWLAHRYENGLGGILADDMGLGKTLQTLALIVHAVDQRSSAGRLSEANGDRGVRSAPWLVVAPASVVGNWVAEAARFAPGLRVASVTRTQLREKAKLAQLASENDVVVMSYNLFRLDFDDVEDVRWSGLVLDEAQFVKNHRSRAHECAKALDTQFKLAITGTPLENNVIELWSILDIVAPGLFPSIRRFTEQFARPLTHVRGADAVPAGISQADAARVIAKLRKRIRPFLLRRTKALVAPELPEKQEQTLRVELAPKHRRLYEQFLQRERQKLLGIGKEEFDKARFILFRSLTLLRMLALDASLIDEDRFSGIPSAKLDALLEQLDDVVAEGHRALVFSQFTSFLGKVEKRLDDAGIAYEYLDGSTANRPEVIARFKNGTAPVFLISLKAGGFGLNLTEADYVFLLDPWWNPASEAQAVDRTHRIGQANPVNVYRIVADGTIEDKVMKLRDEKAELFDRMLDDDGAFSSALSPDEIRGLLDL